MLLPQNCPYLQKVIPRSPEKYKQKYNRGRKQI